MLRDIFRIAFLCVILGSASIPLSFNVNSSPAIVWIGNALGSLFSAIMVVYIGNRITDDKFTTRVRKRRIGDKVVTTFEQGNENKVVIKVRVFINKHGLRLFSLVCPIFPGVLLSTVAVYIFDLDKKIYKRWMFTGVIFVSGLYVLGYWFIFVK